MEGQGYPAEGAPNMVSVAEVCLLMDQHMAQNGLVLDCILCQIDGGPEQAEEAGRGQAIGQIHRQTPLRIFHRSPDPPQAPGKAEVGE